MAENVPPSGDATRGVPYYEKLKRDLRETLQKKRLLDKNLSALEEQLYRFEGAYLEETGAGNIIKGFDNYIKGSGASTAAPSSGGGGGTSTRRKGGNSEQDRVFSRSSASFTRETSPSSSALSTPGNTATPTSAHPSRRESENHTPTATGPGQKAGNKRNKKTEKDEEDEKPAKRLKITYARGERD